MAEYEELAERIIYKVGGCDNICSMSHCATRLKFILKDEACADTRALKTMRGVVTVVEEGGWYQVVLGSSAPEVYRLAEDMTGLSKSRGKKDGSGEQMGVYPYTVAFFTGILAALLLWQTGIVKGMLPAFQVVVFSGSAILLSYLVLYFCKRGKQIPEKGIEEHVPVVPAGAKKLVSPISGRILPLTKVNDRAVSEGAFGDGVAVLPSEGKLYAPADGKVTTLYPTGHVIGMTTEQGMKLLMHVGIGTDKLQGRCFRPKIVQNEIVTRGKLLVEFDLEILLAEGYDTTTTVLLSNARELGKVHCLDKQDVKAGEALFWIEPAENTDSTGIL